MRLSTKILYITFLTVLSLSFFLGYKAKVANAQIPQPKIPCLEDEFRNPEFSSLRGYQASPCGDSKKAVWCGNTITIFENVTKHLSGSQNICNTTSTRVNKRINKTYYINLSGVELPIAGNTEAAENTITGNNSSLSNADKLSEYLSWYLQGGTKTAERDVDAQDDIVNYSGPANKSLPLVVQQLNRFETLWASGVKIEYTNEDEEEIEETNLHNQIVVCTEKNLFGKVPNPWIGEERPIPCYPGGGSDGSEAQGKQYRLVDWWGSKPMGLIDTQKGKKIDGWDGSHRWGYHTPPFPWMFDKYIYYQKAYNEWRGKECFLIRDSLICVDVKIPGIGELHTNVWADFYDYIPMGNVTDKGAKIPVSNGSAVIHPVDQSVISVSTNELLDEVAANYPHLQGAADASEYLMDAMAPKKGTDKGFVYYSTVDPDTDPSSGQCRTIDVRSNDGDNIFTEVDPSAYIVQVDMTIDEIPCKGNCKENYDPVNGTYWEKECSGGASIALNTSTKTPAVEDVFTNTTAGSSSIFRRFFPKIEENAPVSCIANLPAVSQAQYTASEVDNGSGATAKTEIVVKSDGTDGKVSAGDAELFFPYLGSVYEYFLKGIQTALRPQGYGEPLVNGEYCTYGTSPGGGDCSFDMNKINAGIQAAAAKYNVPDIILRAIFEIEMAEYINGKPYVCEDDPYNSAGVAQIVKKNNDISNSSYHQITCSNEQMANDIGMCGEYGEKLSRCSISDAFELMARLLIYKAHRFSSCTSMGSISFSEKDVWYNAACDYYGTHDPTARTIEYAKEIPEDQKRQDGDMNYCDIVCWRSGACPPYPPNP